MSTYKKYGYFPLGLCPRLRTWKISPRQVDRVVNKTRHRRRRRSSLLTPIRRTVDGSYLFTTSLSIVTVAEFLAKKRQPLLLRQRRICERNHVWKPRLLQTWALALTHFIFLFPLLNDVHCIPKPHHLLPRLNPDWFYLNGAVLPISHSAVVKFVEFFFCNRLTKISLCGPLCMHLLTQGFFQRKNQKSQLHKKIFLPFFFFPFPFLFSSLPSLCPLLLSCPPFPFISFFSLSRKRGR